MGQKSAIEWTEATWNPIRGCTRVSEGCRRCYAERTAIRFAGKGQPYEGLVQITNGHPQWTGKVQMVENHLKDPLKWKEPRRIFVNSMSDLFHEALSFEDIDKIFAVMVMSHRHTFQVLTKRPERMLQYMKEIQDDDKDMHRWVSEACEISGSPCASHLIEDAEWPPKNIWLGVSVENQDTADERIPLLIQTPAAVRWLSAEPLLGPIDLMCLPVPQHDHFKFCALTECDDDHFYNVHEKLKWVVAGGESGPGARPMHPDWARALRNQCASYDVPFFFKQWGEYQPQNCMNDAPDSKEACESWREGQIPLLPDGTDCRGSELLADPELGCRLMTKVGKKAAGSLLDGKEWKQYPEVHS